MAYIIEEKTKYEKVKQETNGERVIEMVEFSFVKELRRLLSLERHELTEEQLAFIKARSEYLTAEGKKKFIVEDRVTTPTTKTTTPAEKTDEVIDYSKFNKAQLIDELVKRGKIREELEDLNKTQIFELLTSLLVNTTPTNDVGTASEDNK
jgi:hypothetical protein